MIGGVEVDDLHVAKVVLGLRQRAVSFLVRFVSFRFAAAAAAGPVEEHIGFAKGGRSHCRR